MSGPGFIPVVVLKNCEPELFMHTSWTFQFVSEVVLFSRLLEGLIGGPSI